MTRARKPEILLDPPPNFAVEVLANGRDDVPDYSFVGKDAGLASLSDELLLQVANGAHRNRLGAGRSPRIVDGRQRDSSATASTGDYSELRARVTSTRTKCPATPARRT
jgi:hypothetical protein